MRAPWPKEHDAGCWFQFISQNHGTEWGRLEGTLQTTQFQTPSMGRDATHQVRLARASSSLALTPQGWGSHSPSGQSASQLTRKEAGPPGKESQKDALILEVNKSTEEGSKINAQQIYKKKI